jgi:Domain of unknown function (DUF4838)/Glycosyl hydrolase family 67 N-terminus
MRKFLIFFSLLPFIYANCQEPLIVIGKHQNWISVFRLVIPRPPNDTELKAAKELRKYIEAATGFRLELITDETPMTPVEIVIGKCAGRAIFFDPQKLEPDEFAFRTNGTNLYITGGLHKGLLYGVYDFLEKYVGSRFYAPGAEETPKKPEIRVPSLNYKEKPAFQSREVYYAGMADQDFADKMRYDSNEYKDMLRTIECDRNRPIDSDTSKGSFFSVLRDRSKISNDILIRDYVIQFTNMIAPFPNLHVLQPNIRLFKKFNATGVFEQGCHGTYSENQELREYVLAKLLWNPNLNLDSLMNDFYRGFYGNAASWIKKYINEMEKAQVASNLPLSIYGAPAQETTSFLRPELIKTYDQFFDEAEYSVTLDPDRLPRVRKARLPLRYAKIEIARKNITGSDGFLDYVDGKWVVRKSFPEELNTFVDQSNLYGVTSINESGLSPDQYKKDVLSSIHEVIVNKK